ncbi:MAG: hypothetical protein JW827_12495 [Spirochaetes bacterium]|nr:hypothetical protein [Spirochaetota bacterium]
MKKKCYRFNENTMAAFIENRLSVQETVKLKQHLVKCNHCLKIFVNLHHEIEKMVTTPFTAIPEDLLQKGLDYYGKKKPGRCGRIIIHSLQKGLELLKYRHIDQISGLTPLPVRGGKKSQAYRHIKLLQTHNSIIFVTDIYFHGFNKTGIKIHFSDIPSNRAFKRIMLRGKNVKMICSFRKKVTFPDLSRGMYSIKLDNQNLLTLDIR